MNKAFTLKNTRFILLEVPCKNAFTLAEVLITLGIIGIVAAMTLPAVVNKFQQKTLEAAFKKSVALVSQSLLRAKSEAGLDKLAEYCTYYPYTDNSHEYPRGKECYTVLYNNLIRLQAPNATTTDWISDKLSRREDTIKTYNGKQTVTRTDLSSRGNTIFYTNILPDGSFINYTIMEFKLFAGVDVNGEKKPNQLGHDIFVFEVNPKNDFLSASTPENFTDEEFPEDSFKPEIAGNPCSLTSTQKGNGIGCSYYALRDECPYDNTKKYFECLP